MDAEWLVESMDGIAPAVRKEWAALILLPAVSSIAGSWFYVKAVKNHFDHTLF
jgi:hypothetical protein